MHGQTTTLNALELANNIDGTRNPSIAAVLRGGFLEGGTIYTVTFTYQNQLQYLAATVENAGVALGAVAVTVFAVNGCYVSSITRHGGVMGG